MHTYILDIAAPEDEPAEAEAEVLDHNTPASLVQPNNVVRSQSMPANGVVAPKVPEQRPDVASAPALAIVASAPTIEAQPALTPNRDQGSHGFGFWHQVQIAGGAAPVLHADVQTAVEDTASPAVTAAVPTDAYMLMGQYFVAIGKITESQLAQAISEQNRTFERIGEVLVRLGFVDQNDIAAAVEWQSSRRTLDQLLKMFSLKANHIRSVLHRVEKRGEPMQQVMRDTRYLSEEKVALALASLSNKYQFFESGRIDQCRFADLVAKGIALAKYDGYVPVAILPDGTLAIALEDADRLNDAHNYFGGFSRKMYLLASGHTLQKIYCTYFSQTEKQLMEKIAEAEEWIQSKEEAGDAAGGYMRNLIGLILRHASYSGASDVHIECSRVIGTLMMRYDGVRRDVAYFTPALHTRLTTMLQMDGLRGANEGEAAASVMREGKITFEKDPVMQRDFKDIFDRYGYRLEIGTASNQTITAVIRVIDSQGATADIDNLGLDDYTRGILDEAIAAPDGLILLVGPTGSGKTTTLYAALGEIDAEEYSIQTIENPVEGEHGKWKQYQPKDAAGAAEGAQMGSVFKGAMRNDPDVVLVGEIRDGDVADTAIQASKTGHLVFSTLHVDRAAGTPGRLIGMKVGRNDLADTVRLIMAQRLVRQLCSACAEVDNRPQTKEVVDGAMKRFMSAEISSAKIYCARDGGCDQCRFTGYRGRRMVYEVVKFTKKIRKMIEDGASTSALEAAAIPPGRSMWDYGMRMVAKGKTSLDEIKSVIPDWSEEG